MTDEKRDPVQIADIGNGVLYTFGESTIEVDFATADEVPDDHPFARVKESKEDLL